MKIGTVVWIGNGPFYVANALDLYKKYNLKVSLQVFNDPALIPSAMASGAIDGGMLTYDQVVGQVAGGQAQKVVMPIAARAFGSFVAGIPAPLGMGTVALEDGTQVQGFVCEAYASAQAQDITHFGGSRSYLRSVS